MTVRSTQHALRTAAVAAAVVALLSLTAGRAEAGCGSYVRILDRTGAASHTPMPPGNGPAAPGCSESPDPSTPLTTSATAPSHRDTPAILAVVVPESGAGFTRLLPAADACPISLSFIPLEPPRPA